MLPVTDSGAATSSNQRKEHRADRYGPRYGEAGAEAGSPADNLRTITAKFMSTEISINDRKEKS